MRQAADILASPAAMQIRQLEALQQMAKGANAKVVFVPMTLQSDIGGQLAGGSGSGGNGIAAIAAGEAGDETTGGPAGRAGLLSSMANV